MKDNTLIFDGSIADNYDDLLGPFLFEPYAVDLAKRFNDQKAMNVLELACGTGRLTRHLQLQPSAQLTATDLNAEMLALAKEKVPATTITWATADMQNIPYRDNQFDGIVSQFGLMLVPDRPKALSEIYRVLQKDGKLLYNVWGDLEDNDLWKIGAKVISDTMGIDPIRRDPGPFTMNDPKTVIRLMAATGFVNCTSTEVKITGTIEQAAMAAKGFIRGLPLYAVIIQKDPAPVGTIQETLTRELIGQLGDQPMRSSFHALVFEASK